MTDQEKIEIQRFLDNEVQYQAVRKILEERFDTNRLQNDVTLSNMRLAEILRGIVTGKQLLEEGFRELQKYKQVERKKIEHEKIYR